MKKFKWFVYNLIRSDDENGRLANLVDGTIMVLIAVNVLTVVLETFEGIPASIRDIFGGIETFSVIVFTIEYAARVWTSDYIYPEKNPAKARLAYIKSFMSVVDLLAILPFYLPFIIPVDLRVLRTIRLLRLLRILKVNRYTNALATVGAVLRRKASQLISSLFVVSILMIIASVLMYNIEYEAQPGVFANAFSGLWWAVATLTTVGYGDIYPVTVLGKILSSVIALLGIGLVAVPTGIISAGFMERIGDEQPETKKPYCPYCGKKLE